MTAGCSDLDRAELQRIGRLIESAHTLPEVQEAQEALRAWVCEHPEQKERLTDVFEQLFMMQESAREIQAENSAMDLSPEEVLRREQVFALRRRVRAEDLPEVFCPAIAAARQALQEWQTAHPEDPQLPYLREALDAEETVALSLHSNA